MRRIILTLLLALGFFSRPWYKMGAEAPAFENLGIPVRVGGLMGCIVGPNGKGGEALYFNFNQLNGKLFLVQVDPDTGEARQFNSPEGPGAWAFIAGPDGRIYLGTWDGALILRFDPGHPELGIQVLGSPAKSESYLWQYALGTDGWLYACTYPGAKLIRFDPRTDAMEDLGRMHPTEMYARSVAAGPDGRIYVGIGTEKGDLVSYDPTTRGHKSILPAGLRGQSGWNTVGVSRRRDGKTYAEFGTNLLSLAGDTATPVTIAPEHTDLSLRDGRVVTTFERGRFALKNPLTGEITEKRFKYAGAGDRIFVVGNGPRNTVYGSTAMPLEVFRFDPSTARTEHLGNMPGGEVYSLLPEGDRLYLCYYGGAVMNLYDPANPDWRFGTATNSNPISFGGIGDGHLRPRAMIRGADHRIYIGSEPPYGQLGGALGVWDPLQNRTVENYRHVVTNQSIVSLAWESRTGLLFGGSGNFGGGGTKPVEKEAKLFAFDPRTRRKVFETALSPGARSYPAIAAAQGRVFAAVGDQLFVVDALKMQTIATNRLPGTQVEISLAASGTKLIGLTSRSVYEVDATSGAVTELAATPKRVDCGFALEGGAVYFGSGAELWRYRYPVR